MYIVIGSATTAQRLKKIITQKTGLPVYVVQTPSKLRRGGCSYSLKINDKALNAVKQIAAEAGVSYKGIFREATVKGERVYHAVS